MKEMEFCFWGFVGEREVILFICKWKYKRRKDLGEYFVGVI